MRVWEKKAVEAFFAPTLSELALKNGYIGTLEDVVSYCNEQQKDCIAKNLFKCNPDCKHNAPIKSQN